MCCAYNEASFFVSQKSSAPAWKQCNLSYCTLKKCIFRSCCTKTLVFGGFPRFSHLWLSAGRWGSNRGQRSLRFYEGTSPSKSQVKAASASKQPQRPRKKAKTKLFPQLVANRPSMCDLSDSSVQNIHSTTQCGIYKIKKKCENIILFTPSPGTSS